ncbi:MAG: hypothetical protein GX049_14640 [Alcaligenaceae bacterium]|nr:hypothetical protein [Alcaligenaceae bacterium]
MSPEFREWPAWLVRPAGRFRFMPRVPEKTVLVRAAGWQIDSYLPDTQIELQRFWRGFAWLTLQFVCHEPGCIDTGSPALTSSVSCKLTLFRHQLSLAAWSDLRVCVAGDLVARVRRHNKEQA